MCLSGTVPSESVQHASDTQGVDWNREERGGSEGGVGVAIEHKGRGGRIRSESLQRPERDSHNSPGY